jgi:chromosomal replication initiation ATPase DnaA
VRALRAQVFKLRVASSQGECPKENGDGAGPVSQAQAAKSGDAPTFSALAEQPPAVLGRITVRRVLEVTAEHFHTSVSELLSHRRAPPLCRQRQVAMYVARKMTGHGLPLIGRKMGRDHTTILHGARVVKGLIEASDAETIAAVNQIIDRLQPIAPPPPPPETPAQQPDATHLPAVSDQITVHRVLEVTAHHFGTTVPDLLSGSREPLLCHHRQVAMYVAREMTAHSLRLIGSNMGGRDHRTILHGVRVVKGLIEAGDAEAIAAVNQIIERLQVTGGAHD